MKTFLASWWKKIFSKKGSAKPLISSTLDIVMLKSVRQQPYPRLRQIKHFKRFMSRTERLVYRLGLLALSVGVIWLGYTLFLHHTTEVAAQGGDYVEGTVGAPSLINPLYASLNEVDKDLTRLVYSGLMKVDENGNLVLDLAESVNLSEDKKTYTFVLKKNVVWHDGEAFTSSDVVFTFDLMQNRTVNSPLLVSFQGVKVAAVDDYTVTFTLPEVYTPFPSSLTVGILPEHIWSEIPVEQIRLARTNLQPIGTGPFKFSRMVTDKSGFISEYTLERFDRYYQRAAYLDHFSFRFYSSYEGEDPATSAIEAMRQQNIEGVNFIPVNAKDKVERKRVIVYNPQLPQYTALFFNQKRQPALVEKELRIALSEAIDKEKIIKDTQKGDAAVIGGAILPGFPGFKSDATGTLAYSLDSANSRLDKLFDRVNADEQKEKRRVELQKEWMNANPPVSGTTSTVPAISTSTPEMVEFVENTLTEEFANAQTFFRKPKKGGDVLVLDMVTVDTAEYRRAAEIIVGAWQEIGIKTRVSYISAKALSRDILRDRKYDVLLYGVLLGSDPDQYPFWHSSQSNYPGLNLAQYSNKTVDDVLKKIRETEKVEEVSALYRQFEDQILQDVPAVFLYSPQYHYAVDEGIKGIVLNRITEPSDRLMQVTNWYKNTKRDW